jgi:hypothetical protein
MTHEQEIREARKQVHTATDSCPSIDLLDLVHKLLLTEQEQRQSPRQLRGGGSVYSIGTGRKMAAR